MYFFKTPSLFKYLYQKAIWNGNKLQKKIYLTFDDGPIKGITDIILDILKHYKVKATFFCVGQNIKKNPVLFKRINMEGHLIGNHTMNHLNSWNHRIDDYISDIDLCEAEIDKYIENRTLKLFRPPYGRIKRKAYRVLTEDYKIIMWDVLSYDFSTRLKKEQCLENSINYTKPGSIIIFHDSGKTKNKIEFVISEYVQHFMARNYEFCTIDDIFLDNQ